jgi:hypothetical protein
MKTNKNQTLPRLRGSKSRRRIACFLALVGMGLPVMAGAQQEEPPQKYFPTVVEEVETRRDITEWEPPRELWPAEPVRPDEPRLAPDEMEDPGERIETRFRPADELPKPNERGIFTDSDKRSLHPGDREMRRPPELWPRAGRQAVGRPGPAEVRYKEGVSLSRPVGDVPVSYAISGREEPYPENVGGQAYYPVTEVEQVEWFQNDVIGQTSDALWYPGLWSPTQVGTPYAQAPGVFQPIDDLLMALTTGRVYDGARGRPPRFNPVAYNDSVFWRNEQVPGRFYTGNVPSYDFRRPGLRAYWSNSYGVERPFGYEASVGVGGRLGIGMGNNYRRPLMLAGPLIVQDITLRGAALWTDFDGQLRDRFLDGRQVASSGWISILEASTNLQLRLTQNFYIGGRIGGYYLPSEDEWGWGSALDDQFGLGLTPLSFLRMNYEFEIGNWDWIVFDEVSAGLAGADLFYGIGGDERDPAIARVGRYSFGTERALEDQGLFQEGGDGADVDLDDFYISNIVGISGVGYVVPETWRGLFLLSRSDYWVEESSFRPGDDRSFYHNLLRVDNVNPAARWHSFASLESRADTDFEDVVHNFLVGTTGNLLENVTITADAGYGYRYGDDVDDEGRVLMNLSIFHEINRYLRHELSLGQTYFDGRDAFGEDGWARYISYNLTGYAGPYTEFGLFARAQENDYSRGGGTQESWLVGASVNQNLGDRIEASMRIAYFYQDAFAAGRGEREGWEYRASLASEVAPDLFLSLLYRYLDQSSDFLFDSFEEHLFLVSLTKRF